MKHFLAVYILTVTSVFAQTIDYNTNKGFVAEGYDVVAYFNKRAMKGSKSYTTTFDGAKYKFYSQQNLDIFLKAPTTYIPQYGGYCAYAVAINSKKVDINPETFEIREGKLFLFYNSWGNNTLKKWLKSNVKGLKEKADLNWETIKFN
ncbi:YHS domain-containing (seleno)protein [Winogradskyella sp. PE311]|uniref:YHS domain-containing (seleno)protein n=1 Tax=Winogradskyella sp. PE311 TaxID=3366943 RepID=UPI00398013B2